MGGQNKLICKYCSGAADYRRTSKFYCSTCSHLILYRILNTDEEIKNQNKNETNSIKIDKLIQIWRQLQNNS